MTKTMTAERAFGRVASAAEQIRNDERRVVEVMSPGDNVRQGDIYITFLDREPRVIGPHESRQLAEGNTQGSRHTVEGDCEVLQVDGAEALEILHRLVPDSRNFEQFVGPMIRAPKGCEVPHPEHAHYSLPPGSHLVTIQRAHADVVRRAAD